MLWCLCFTSQAATFDDALQQQRFEAVVEQLQNDADPNTAIPMLYDYMMFYIWIGYSDPTEFDPVGDIDRTFGKAYSSYFERMAKGFNERLGQCDATVVAEILEYLDFHEIGYSSVSITSTADRIQNSEFWSGYAQWQANDAIRDRLGGEHDSGGLPINDLATTLELLRKGNSKQQQAAASSLGSVEVLRLLSTEDLHQYLRDSNSLVRYWGLVMAQQLGGKRSTSILQQVRQRLSDHSWPVRIKAAQLLQNWQDATSVRAVNRILDHTNRKPQPWPRSQYRDARHKSR